MEESVEDLVAHRNETGSRTLILADASSLTLLTRKWRNLEPGLLPDALFFSFRKHAAIPYDGTQDELEQMKYFESCPVAGTD